MVSQNSSSKPMLFLGASGQTGGPFLTVFRKKYPDIPITVFLRSTELDNALQALGRVTIIHGTFNDVETIEKLSAAHPIIINCAASTYPPLTEAILRGIRARKTQEKPILLHLSGAGNFSDGGESGDYVPQEHPFNDSNRSHVQRISSSMRPNGACDELILNAATAGDVNAFFVSPGGIYGASANHVGLRTGAASALAPGVWVGWMLQNIETLGFSPYVGNGTGIFPTIHVDDVVELMMLVFQKALEKWSSYEPDDVYSHYYLCVDERHSTKALATAFADLLYRTGKMTAPDVRSVPYEKAGIVARYLGGNILLENDNAKSLGWKAGGPGLVKTLRQTK